MDRIVALSKELFEIKDAKKDLEEQLKTINKRKEQIETRDLPELMDDQTITNLGVEGYGTIFLQVGTRAYINVDDRDEAYNWLKDGGFGDIIKPTVHHSTLKAFVREQLDNGQSVPDMFHPSLYNIARTRRS
jgi:hypothetical protein